jgi:sugar O-acyltransferase (sialic acid O-acetyltransferase NeuD family)
MKLVVIGARADNGAHMMLDLIADGVTHEIVAFLDDNPDLWGTRVEGVPVLGPAAAADQALDAGATGAVLFLGTPGDRERIGKHLLAAGLQLPVIVHPRAYVAPSATLGRGTFVGAMATVSTGARVGELVMIGATALVSHHVEVGDYAQVSPGCRLAGRCRIGRRAFLGLGAIVAPERDVGEDAMVWAGAVVSANVAPGATIAAVPARPIRAQV